MRMGSYNSQYESYYSKIVNNKKNHSAYGNNYNTYSSSGRREDGGNYIMRRLLRELIGVLCLFLLVIICKSIVTPQTTAVYNYSKQVVNKTYDYTKLINNIESTNYSDIQEDIENYIEAIKVKITGGKTIKDRIRDKFMPPYDGVVTSNFGNRTNEISGVKEFHKGVDIFAAEDSEVRASYDGKIKECGENETLGKYILINHGSGIETRYGHLKEIKVNKDTTIKKGDIIARSGVTGESKDPHIHFEVLYMGQVRNPLDYIKFSTIEV
jgi:murein DD-endopeptidase MepM/ murein hydrolase activator NlpD